MKWNQSFFLPFIPNPFSYCMITLDDRLVHKSYFRIVFDENIKHCTSQAKPKGLFGVFGYGDVVIGLNGVNYSFNNIIGAFSLATALGRRKLSEEERKLLYAIDNSKNNIIYHLFLSIVLLALWYWTPFISTYDPEGITHSETVLEGVKFIITTLYIFYVYFLAPLSVIFVLPFSIYKWHNSSQKLGQIKNRKSR